MDFNTIRDAITANSDMFYIYCSIAGLSLLILIGTWFGRKRIGFASKCGKLEHMTGRLIGVLLIMSGYLAFFKSELTFYSICITFIVWFIYLVSHTLEKFFYGNKGPRG